MPSTATNRLYGLTTSVAVKPPCRVATTAAITLSGLQTIDGVALAVDDRVLVKNQASTVDNGIYYANTSAWTRVPDFDGPLDAVKGTIVLVQGGSDAPAYYELTTADPVVIGSSTLTFTKALTASSALLSFLQAGAGAVERTAQDKMREVISAEDFGVAVGNTPAANTTGMLAMRNYMRDNPLRHFEVRLPRGLIQFTDAKWLHNVRSISIKGGPTQLQNTLVSASSTEKVPIWMNEFLLDNAGTPAGYGTQVNGYLIDTVAKGSSSVELVTASDDTNFVADALALVYGYNNTSVGYPPSMRFFEFRRIKSVAAGVITFYEPLINEYRSDWVDIATNSDELFGKARILPLQRTGFKMTELCELEDLQFLPSNGYVDDGTPSTLGGSLIGGGCMKLLVTRCEIGGYYYPTQGMTHEVEDCVIRATEVDKLIDRVTFRNCDIRSLSNGPACNFLRLDGGRILEPISSLNVRDFTSENTRFSQGTTSAQIINAAQSIRQSGVKIINPIIDTIDAREVIDTAPSQAGMTATEIKLAASSSAVDDYYTGMQVLVLSGTGLRQIRTISDYVGATKVATVSVAWVTQPDATSVYRLDRVLPLLSRGASLTLTVIAATAPNKITCAYAGLNDTVLRGVGQGSLLRSTTTATRIKVSQLYYDGVNTVIEGQWIGGTPGAAEVFRANICSQLVVENPTILSTQSEYRNNTAGSTSDLVASGSSPPQFDELVVTGNGRTPSRIVLPFVFHRDRTGGTNMRVNVNGVVTAMQVYVSDGAGAAGTLIITRPATEGVTPYTQTIDLQTVGGRRMDGAVTSTALGTDILQAVVPAFHQQINFATAADLTADPPLGYVIVEIAPSM